MIMKDVYGMLINVYNCSTNLTKNNLIMKHG